MPITNLVYNLQETLEIKQICRESKTKIEEMLFFSCARSMLYAEADETFSTSALRIFDIYNDFKSNLSSFFIHLDQQLKIEMNITIGKLLDEVFYTKVLIGLKTKLNSDPSTRKIVSEIDKVGPACQDAGISTSDLPTVYINPVYPTITSSSYKNDHSNYLRENLYKGQLNESGKREGYGKITFFGGDTYEGFWENDKPHGEGLYIWKIGGKYLGTFIKGAISGQGKRIYPSGNYYNGAFLNGKKHGNGEMMYKNGDTYEGEWEDDYINGHGKYS